jgi:hypothetical protein
VTGQRPALAIGFARFIRLRIFPLAKPVRRDIALLATVPLQLALLQNKKAGFCPLFYLS